MKPAKAVSILRLLWRHQREINLFTGFPKFSPKIFAKTRARH